MAIIEGTVVGSGEAGFYPYEIEQSLRFEDGSSAYLSRTPASAGNRKTWTFSTWVKRGNLGINDIITNDYTGGAEYAAISIGTDDQLNIENRNSSDVYVIQFKTARKFRDVSAWYHILIKVDTTQTTQSERFKLFINGEQETSFATAVYPAQNADTTFLKQKNTNIFKHGNSGIYGDGYLAETHFTDGTAYDATAFGEFKNGVWIPKTPDVTYGTNGFYLDYSNGASIGADSSGNSNNWTPTNLASTDVMLDSPTNNFATLNPLDKSSSISISEGNLKHIVGTAAYANVRSTIGMVSGKWYWEALMLTSNSAQGLGLSNADASLTNYLGNDANGVDYISNGNKVYNGTGTAYGSTFTTGDIISASYDADSGSLVFYKNGVSQGTALTGLTGEWFATIANASNGSTSTTVANFGQDSSFAGNKTPQGYTDANGRGDFYYAPPAGYLALCTANLPEPAIGPNSATTSDEHFNTVLWTGTGGTDVVTGVGFQPDLVWNKPRNTAQGHIIQNAISGAGYFLSSDSTAAETYNSVTLSSFDTDGFTYGTSVSGRTYVAWNWKANGSGVSNTDGTITSTVSANVDAGFSIVSYTGTGAAATVGHGLNSAPEMVIVKSRNGSGTRYWRVYHSGLSSATYSLELNTTNAQQSTADVWNSTAPTSSVFSVQNSEDTNQSGSNQIAYCFHSVEGYSKFGSYTGNGSTDGPFVYTGFRPAFVMYKRTDSANDWIVVDHERNTYNAVDLYLHANLSAAENTADLVDFTSNGFKVRNNFASGNASGGTYIFACFAESPFKYSNAR